MIAGAIGRRSIAYRLPFSAAAAEASREDLELIRDAGEGWRTAVFADYFARDYNAASADDILANVDRLDPSKGLVLLLHDGGGDRSATVEALEQLVPLLRERGFTFVSLSEAMGANDQAINPPAPAIERWSGLMLITVLRVVGALRGGALLPLYALLGWGFLKVALDVVLLLAHRRKTLRRAIVGGYRPTVSVLVPAYNESVSIADALRTIAASDYPLLVIIVIDDGSSDNTASIASRLGIANVKIIVQRNAGKAAALNRGVAAARGDIVICVDADTVFQRDTASWIVQPFAKADVGAVSGNVKVGNRHSLLGRWQHLEYSHGQQTERRAQEMLGLTWCIPGAIGAFRREALQRIGGFTVDTMAEDTDVAVRVYLDGWRSVFEPRAIAWTEVPTTWRPFGRQRIRWHFGSYQVLWKHRKRLGRRPRRFGLLMLLPYTFVSLVVTPLVLPVIDVLAVTEVAADGPGHIVRLWLLMNVFRTASAMLALHSDGEKMRSAVYFPVQQFVIRWMYVLLSIKAMRMALAGQLVVWNSPNRAGDAGETMAETSTETPTRAGAISERGSADPAVPVGFVPGVIVHQLEPAVHARQIFAAATGHRAAGVHALETLVKVGALAPVVALALSIASLDQPPRGVEVPPLDPQTLISDARM